MWFDENDRVYRHLRETKEGCATTMTREDRAAVLIGACISNGFDTRHQIIKGLRVTGVSPKLAARILDEQTGDVGGVHLWCCDNDGVYRLHPTTIGG